MSSNQRYFVSPDNGGGLEHRFHDLENFIKDSYWLGRTPVLGKYHPGVHDADSPLGFVDWERYIDLPNTTILRLQQGEALQRLAPPFHYIKKEDFDMDAYSEDQILSITSEADFYISEEQNQHYPVIEKKDFESWIRRITPIDAPDTLLDPGPFIDPILLIDFEPSAEVKRLTNIVLRAFGTNPDDADTLRYFFFNRWRSRLAYAETPVKTYATYIGMHIRTFDNWATTKSIKPYSKSNIKRFLNQTIWHIGGIPYSRKRKLPIYIMSNITTPSYFDFLKPDFDVYSYTDFPELKQLVSGDSSVRDPTMLYAVERNIMRYALIRIVPPYRRSGLEMYYDYHRTLSNITVLLSHLVHRARVASSYFRQTRVPFISFVFSYFRRLYKERRFRALFHKLFGRSAG